jgi:copper resistance protein B
MNPNRARSAVRFAATALALLVAQSVVARVEPALAQSEPSATGMPGMPGMTAPATGVTAPRAATPPAAILPTTARPPPPPPASPGLGDRIGIVKPPDPTGTAGWPNPVNDNALNSFLLFDLFEFQHGANVDAARWDVLGWLGGDTERIWFKSEGRYNSVLRAGEMDVQVLYGRLISPFVDFQAGFRYEQQLSWDNGLGRPQAVVGVQGLVPYGMEAEVAIFVSQNGAVSGRATLAQDFLLTQRLILQPRFEINAAVQSAAQYGVGAGVNDIEIGLRLRYEILREVAPYVGVSWLKSFGESSNLRSAAGENTSVLQLVAGFRIWF